MDAQRRLHAQKLFELEVRRAKGNRHQDLVNSVLSRRHSDFVPMQPYGRLGDCSNDGYVPSSGTYYQVYAPNDPTKAATIARAATKAATDFAGLITRWTPQGRPIREYRFAFNDGYSGSVVPVEKALADIERTHGVRSRPFLAKDLESEAMALSEDDLQTILGTVVPEPGILASAKYSAVRDVVEHVMRNAPALSPVEDLIAPDFDAKIRFNRLSPRVADLLRFSAYQADVVDDYFSRRSGNHRQALRDHLAEIYARELAGLAGTDADLLFFAVLQAITPPSQGLERSVQDAALVIMAYYFEACDIFESPADAAAR